MSIIVNTPHIDALADEANSEKRQEEYAMRACLLMERYVPIEEGTLRGSAHLHSRFERGLIIYATPYAAKQYYVPMNHSKEGTTDHWDEACARNHKAELIDYAKLLLLEG